MKLKIITDSMWQNPQIDFFGGSGEQPTQTLNPSTEDYNDKIKNHGTFLINSILPPAIRYVDHAKGIVAFERPPGYVHFNFSPHAQIKLKLDGDSKKVISLPLPWQLYVAKLGRNGLPSLLFVFFSSTQLNSLTTPLNRAPLPNIYGNGTVCLPTYNTQENVQYDLIDAISNIYNIVWNSGFNLDVFQCAMDWVQMMSGINPLSNKKFQDNQIQWYNHWSSYSLEDIVNMNWNSQIYSSFGHLLTLIDQLESTEDYYDSVVDLYLAAK